MRIGFCGNVNNYPFMVARAMRRLGHECLFIVDSCARLHRPEYRYEDISIPYPSWIHDVSPLRELDCLFPTPKRINVVRLLRSCDAIILNGLGPSLSIHVNRPAIVLLTGSDLDYYANLKTVTDLVKAVHKSPVFLRRVILKWLAFKLVLLQRGGIRSALAVSYFAPGLNPDGDLLLDELGLENSKRLFILMTDTEKIQRQPLPHNCPARIFCAARLTWKKPMAMGTCELDYKGSDIMVHGLGAFIRRTGIPLDIRLVRKGLHVAETRRLVEEEGLAKYVTWLEEMSQLEVLAEYKQADIVFDQLGQSMVAMAGLDAMAMGRPVIANGRPEIIGRVVGVPSPICQAGNPEEVCAQLERLEPHPVERECAAAASRQYVESYFSADHAAQLCLERLSKSL